MRYIIILLTIFFSASAQDNPYAVFGYEDRNEYNSPYPSVLTLVNNDTSAPMQKIEVDFWNFGIKCFGRKDSLLSTSILKDIQILRWLSLDPLFSKYPSNSPYSAFANNPLLFVDPDGRMLYVYQDGQTDNREDYYTVIFGMVPNSEEIQSRISISTNGMVSFNSDGLSQSEITDPGIMLIQNLVGSSKNYLFEISDVAKGINRLTNEETSFSVYDVYNNPSGPADVNLSVTPRGDKDDYLNKTGIYANQDGVTDEKRWSLFDAEPRKLSNGTIIHGYAVVPKNPYGLEVADIQVGLDQIGLHSLAEVYYRTEGNGMSVTDAHNAANELLRSLPQNDPRGLLRDGAIGKDYGKINDAGK